MFTLEIETVGASIEDAPTFIAINAMRIATMNINHGHTSGDFISDGKVVGHWEFNNEQRRSTDE